MGNVVSSQRWLSRLGQGLELGLATILGLLVLLAVAETFLWVAFERSHAALPEIQGLLLVWLGLLGAAHGVRQGLHLGLDLLLRRMPPLWSRRVERLALLLLTLFGLLLTMHGWGLVRSLVNRLPGTGLPAAVQYVPVALAGFLICLFAVEKLIWETGEGAGNG